MIVNAILPIDTFLPLAINAYGCDKAKAYNEFLQIVPRQGFSKHIREAVSALDVNSVVTSIDYGLAKVAQFKSDVLLAILIPRLRVSFGAASLSM